MIITMAIKSTSIFAIIMKRGSDKAVQRSKGNQIKWFLGAFFFKFITGYTIRGLHNTCTLVHVLLGRA